MTTLGELASAVQEHSNRLASHDGLHSAIDARVTAIESGILQKLIEMMSNVKDEHKDGLRHKDGKDNLPQEFTGDKQKFRGWSHEVLVWAAAIYPEHGKKLLEDATKLNTEFDEDEDLVNV